MYGDNLRFEGEHFGAMDFGSYGMGLGASLTPTGSQLVNTNTAINWGLNNLELTFGSQMSFQQQGHLAQLGQMERDELIRLAKMNQVNLSLHAPHFDASGNVGNAFSEDARKMAVREFKHVVDFADQIGTRTGHQGVPIVIHGTEAARSSPDPQTMMYFTDRDTGNVIPVAKREVSYDESFLIEQGLNKKKGDYSNIGKSPTGNDIWRISPAGEVKMVNLKAGEKLTSNLTTAMYWKDVYEEQMEGQRQKLQIRTHDPEAKKADIKRARLSYESAALRYKSHAEEVKRLGQDVKHFERMHEQGGQYVSTDIYAKEKAIQTIVEVAKYAATKKSTPKLVVENIFPEVVMGNPEFFASTIEDARKKFVEDVSRPKSQGGLGMNKGKATKQAKEMIGITFDIGHANLWKKYGEMPEINPKTGQYTGKMIKVDNNKIREWASMLHKKGLLHHVHITDNLGDQDAHLPVGFGNAPVNDMMKDLKKQGWGRKGERAIMETFGMVQYGGNSFGVPASLGAMGVPLVSGGANWESAAGSYFGAGYPMTGYQTFSDINFQMYGVGFGGLPYATGGALPGKEGSNFSGRPMS